MSVKNYHAFIRAARKAAAKTGGLSLPAARKVYRKVKARLDRDPKGVDVQKHPRIFRESLPNKSRRKAAGLAARSTSKLRKQAGKTSSAGTRSGTPVKRVGGSLVGRVPSKSKSSKGGGAVSGRKSATEKRASGPSRLVVKLIEYVSTPEYTKSGRKGGFHLQLQIHIVALPGLTKKYLDRVAIDWLAGKGTPNGVEVKALGWNGKQPTEDNRGMRVARRNFSRIPFEV